MVLASGRNYRLPLMKKINNIHPGEILQEEFLTPLNISAYFLAKDMEFLKQALTDFER